MPPLQHRSLSSAKLHTKFVNEFNPADFPAFLVDKDAFFGSSVNILPKCSHDAIFNPQSNFGRFNYRKASAAICKLRQPVVVRQFFRKYKIVKC